MKPSFCSGGLRPPAVCASKLGGRKPALYAVPDGNAGAGGTITLGTVTVGNVTFNSFTGTYTLSGGTRTINSALTIARAAERAGHLADACQRVTAPVSWALTGLSVVPPSGGGRS